MKQEARAQALLALVQVERDKACRQLLEDAAARAAAIKREVYRRERALLHQRVVAERSRAEALLRTAAAEQATAARRRGEQADAALLAAVWPRLEAQLLERWAAPASRRQWVDGALAQARQRLPHAHWIIRHAGGWPEAEQALALAQLREQGLPQPSLRTDGALHAGLIIAAGGAELDVSARGLLRDRARIEARLLALAARAAGASAAAQVPAHDAHSMQTPEETPV
jgi:hypothetical protein